MLKELAAHLQRVSWHGEYIKALCPFHQDREPSLLVYPDGYFCLSCHAKGSLERLRANLRGVRPQTRIRIPKKGVNPFWKWYRKFGDQEKIVEIAHSLLLSQKSYGYYLRDRKIDSMIKRCTLGWLEGWYVFPIFSKSAILETVVLRASPLTQAKTGVRYLTPPEPEGALYVPDWETSEKSPYLLVCYGIIDALSLASIGLPAATWNIGKILPAYALESFRKPIFVLPDSGEEIDAHKLAGQLGWRGHVHLLDYPPGLKDPSDLLQEGLLDGQFLDRSFRSRCWSGIRGEN